MSLMISEIYDALIAAGAPAEALTVHGSRFSKIEADLLVIKWMLGFVLALLAAIASKLFSH